VQVECSDAQVCCWNGGDLDLAANLASLTGYTLEELTSGAQPPSHTRQIRGCIVGEPVYVNGIVIGRATGEVVVLRSGQGTVEPVSGLEPKLHGIEKLLRSCPPDISTAWCKSGAIRTSVARPGSRAGRYGRVAVIDHCGHEIYTRLSEDCCGVLAVGDDTTTVCGHICTHRGIPVLGITDNDCDTILPSAFAPGSLILDTRPERDDDVGAAISASVPEGPVCWDDWAQKILDHYAGRVTVVLDLREPSP
jgi:hypothetical protein